MEENQEARASLPGPRRGHSSRRLGAIGAVVFAAGLVIGVILAGLNVAGAQTSPSPSASTGTQGPKFGRFGPGLFGHGGFGPGFGAIHGEFTTPAPGGGYQTLATQRGTVTAVSPSSITVKSEDGFARTYGVDGNTVVTAGNNGIADVKTGDTVRILAVVSSGKANAVEIMDATRLQQLRGRWQPPFPSASG
jgi:hypothetical protein